MTGRSRSDQLERARPLILTLQSNQQIRTALLANGFTTEMLDAGQSYYDEALAARDAVHQAQQAQLAATEQLTALRTRVEGNVAALSKLARQLYRKDTPTLERLGLRLGQRATPDIANAEDPVPDGSPQPPRRRSRSQAALIDRGYLLYNGILGDDTIQQELVAAGVPTARVQEEQALLDQLAALDAEQEQRIGRAETATARQKAAFTQLNQWLSRTRTAIRMSLRTRPDLLAEVRL